MSIASVSGRLRAQRQAASPMPPARSFKRDGWIRVLRAMDMAKYGEPRELINWRWTVEHLRSVIAARMAAGEPFPPRSSWQVQPTASPDA